MERSRKGRDVRDNPSEFEGRVDVSAKVNEIKRFCTGAGGSPNVIIDIAEKELGDGASVRLEQGPFLHLIISITITQIFIKLW